MADSQSNAAGAAKAEQPRLIVIDGVTYGGSRPHTPESLAKWEAAMADYRNNVFDAAIVGSPRIVIKKYTGDIKGYGCALCGGQRAEVCLEDLFIEGTNKPVCRSCGLKYAPDISETLHTAQRARAERELRCRELKAEVLSRYQQEEAKPFIQLDCVLNGPGTADTGYVITREIVNHLMDDSFTLRLLIPNRHVDVDALALLNMLKEWVNREIIQF